MGRHGWSDPPREPAQPKDGTPRVATKLGFSGDLGGRDPWSLVNTDVGLMLQPTDRIHKTQV